MVSRKQNRKAGNYRLITLIGVSVALLVFLASCGQNSPVASNSSTDVQLSPTLSTPSSSAGEVTLRVASVSPNAISFSLANKSNQAILFSDHLTECSVILLQAIPQGTSNKQWQAVAPCRTGIQSRQHELAPGKDLIVALSAPGGQWAAGLYRAMLTYALAGAKATPQAVFSASFPIESSNPCQRTDIACQASPGP